MHKKENTNSPKKENHKENKNMFSIMIIFNFMMLLCNLAFHYPSQALLHNNELVKANITGACMNLCSLLRQTDHHL